MRFEDQRLRRAAMAALATALWLFTTAPPADAGCGCDHPPPTWAQVMPPFASPGMTIRVHAADGNAFQVGASYDVTLKSGAGVFTVDVDATASDFLELVTPANLEPGPTEITVSTGGNQGVVQTFANDVFTTLPIPPVLSPNGGASKNSKLTAAIAADGTLLLPLNLRHVRDGMQLAFQVANEPLEFGPDDVVIYNADGVDLTLFTLAVDGQTAMEWGSYYGWEVEDDTGLFGVVYDTKVQRSTDPGKSSDVLTYWRHEFQTYRNAHMPGGSHEGGADGLHPDGSLHINHGHLVLAIHAMKRSANDPDNPATLKTLTPGRVDVDVRVLAVPTEEPIEPDAMLEMFDSTGQFDDFLPDECQFDEFAEDGDSQGCDGGGNGNGGGNDKDK
jgi:hypothetical protein